jgi:hypothetical protein
MRSNIPRRLKQLEQEAHIHEAPQPVIFVCQTGAAVSVEPGGM